jgi:hypothetical protein
MPSFGVDNDGQFSIPSVFHVDLAVTEHWLHKAQVWCSHHRCASVHPYMFHV